MYDLAAIQKSIVQLVALSSGLDNSKIATVRGGKLPQLSGQYCTVKLNTVATLGTPSPSYSAGTEENTLDETITAAGEFTLSLNFYRDGAKQLATNMIGASYRSTVQAFLYLNNLGWLGMSAINDLTGAFSGETEERAQVNLKLILDGATVSQINQALSVDVDIRQASTPEIITFYAYDAQQSGEFLAFKNEPIAA